MYFFPRAKMKIISLLLFYFIRHISCDLADYADQEKCVRVFYRGKNPSADNSTGCVQNAVCSKVFNISYIIMPPYSPTGLNEIIKICCGLCAKHRVLNYFDNITQVNVSTMKSSHFVYPFLARSDKKQLHGRYFIPVVKAPISFYITERNDSPMFRTIFELYPLLIICILMAIISGFIAWITETWTNAEQFPRPFMIGWYEGFWWSFVTMTTVGYGDKTPKTVPARLFSIIWVFIGMISIGILTASLTKEILKIDAPDIPDMRGAKVGVLNFRDYDAHMVAEHGGIVVEIENATTFQDEIGQLLKKMWNKEIDGVLFDKYTMWLITDVFNGWATNRSHSLYEEIDFFLNRTIRTPLKPVGQQHSYGLLVKDYKDFVYFHDIITEWELNFETQYSLSWNVRRASFRFHSTQLGLFSANQHYFQDTLAYMVVIIGVIWVFGIVYEIIRRRHDFKAKYHKERFKPVNENGNRGEMF